MLEYFKNLIQEAKKAQEEKQKKILEFINTQNDEVIWKTSFLPLKWWWANFKTHQLIIDEYWNYILKVKYWFPLIFILAFSIPLFISIINLWVDFLNNNINDSNIWEHIWWLIIWIVLSWVITSIFYFISVSKILDFQNWYFYDLRFRENLFEKLNQEKYKNKIIPINNFYAIQIVSELVTWKNSSYTSYELNMILKDSSRINIIDHWDLEEIRKNAFEISNKLWIKIYDITQINAE